LRGRRHAGRRFKICAVAKEYSEEHLIYSKLRKYGKLTLML